MVFTRQYMALEEKGVQTMQGEKELFPIQPLMNLIYGKYLPAVEKKLIADQDVHRSQITPEMFLQTVTYKVAGITGLDLSKPFDEQFKKDLVDELKRSNDLREVEIDLHRRGIYTVQDNTNATLDNTWALGENTLTIQQANDLLQAIRNGKVTLPPEVMTALARAFQQSDEQVLKDAGRKMRWCFWKNKVQILRELLGDAANLATIAPVIAQLGKDFGPVLLELVKTVVVR